MKLSTRIFNTEFMRRLLSLIAAGYVFIVHLTSRWQVIDGHIPKKFWDQDRPFILCFWHGRLLMLPYSWNRKKSIHILISMHRDGRLISGAIGHFGIQTISGSTSKGGAAALRVMIRTLKAGGNVGITPDGPRGPRMRASDGVVTLARIARIPVIPVSYSTHRRKVLGSWDRFILALPFSRGVFKWGDPIDVPHTSDKEILEDCRLEIETALNRLSAEVDEMTGHRPIQPADLQTGKAGS